MCFVRWLAQNVLFSPYWEGHYHIICCRQEKLKSQKWVKNSISVCSVYAITDTIVICQVLAWSKTISDLFGQEPAEGGVLIFILGYSVFCDLWFEGDINQNAFQMGIFHRVLFFKQQALYVHCATISKTPIFMDIISLTHRDWSRWGETRQTKSVNIYIRCVRAWQRRLTEHTEPIVHGDHNDISVGSKDAAIEHVSWALHVGASVDEQHHRLLTPIPNICTDKQWFIIFTFARSVVKFFTTQSLLSFSVHRQQAVYPV